MRKLDHVRRSGKVGFHQVIAAVRTYANSGLEPQFVKHPATWLNAGCWDDEPAAVNGVPASPKVLDYAKAWDLRAKEQLEERERIERERR